MLRRPGVLGFAALALVVGACSGTDIHTVDAIAPKVAAAPVSTTSTSLVATPAAVAVAAKRIQRVSSLPGEDAPPKAPKQAAYHGPTPTGRISIPRIGLDHLTYEGIDLATIDYGPSHWPGTALPGQIGNAVFPGHRVTHDHPFFDIDLIQIGDPVTFTNSSGSYTYEVTDTFVVNADETWIADPTDTPTMTIFGCHPKHSAKQRYVVKGKLIKSTRSTSGAVSEHAPDAGNYPIAPDPSEPATTTTTPKKGGLSGLLGGGR